MDRELAGRQANRKGTELWTQRVRSDRADVRVDKFIKLE